MAQGMESAFVNVQLVIGAVAALGLADRLTPDVRNLLGREPIALDHFVADHLASWRRPERGRSRQPAGRTPMPPEPDDRATGTPAGRPCVPSLPSKHRVAAPSMTVRVINPYRVINR
jgi:hypothetical protein